MPGDPVQMMMDGANVSKAVIDAERAIDRRGEVSRRDGIFRGIGTDRIAGSVNGSALNAAAGQQHRIAIGPMIATSSAVDLRSATELTGHHDHC